jgi:hypothetical protein
MLYTTVMGKKLILSVTRRNLFQRINRALKKKGRNLRTHPGKTGTVYVVDLKRSRVLSVNQGLEQLAVQLGVLEDFEQVEQIDEDARRDAEDVARQERRTSARLRR